MLDRGLEGRGPAVNCAGDWSCASEGGRQLNDLATALSPLGSPTILFSASHSGSRMLAVMLQRLGVFMGSHLNDSEDSLDVFELVRYLVEAHAPDYSKLFCDGDPSLKARTMTAFKRTWSGAPTVSAGAGNCQRPAT